VVVYAEVSEEMAEEAVGAVRVVSVDEACMAEMVMPKKKKILGVQTCLGHLPIHDYSKADDDFSSRTTSY